MSVSLRREDRILWGLRYVWSLARGLVCNICQALFIAVVLVISKPFMFLLGPSFRYVWKQALPLYALIDRYILGLSYEIRGLEKIPSDGRVIFAVQHQSAWETAFGPPLLDERISVVVLKRELLCIPLFASFVESSGCIAVDRDVPANGLRREFEKMVVSARRALDAGRSVLIFPEGTRAEPGIPIRCKAAVGLLYARLSVPVVPVALNSGLYRPRRGIRMFPGKVVLSVMDPIMPGVPVKEFIRRLEATLERESRALIVEASQLPSPPLTVQRALENLSASARTGAGRTDGMKADSAGSGSRRGSEEGSDV